MPLKKKPAKKKPTPKRPAKKKPKRTSAASEAAPPNRKIHPPYRP